MKNLILGVSAAISVVFSATGLAATKAGTYNVARCFFEGVIENLRLDVVVDSKGKVVRFDTLGTDFRNTVKADILQAAVRPDGKSVDFITSGRFDSTTTDEIGASGWLRSVEIERSSSTPKVKVSYDFLDVHGGVATESFQFDVCRGSHMVLCILY